MNEKLQYDIENFTIYATDAEMAITSSSHDLVPGEGPHASVSKSFSDLKQGDVLNLSFSGGTSQQPEAATGAQSQVFAVPNDAEDLSMLLMIILLLALVAFVGIAMKEPRVAGTEALHLNDHRNLLVARLAKLDDLHETGAIPAAAYQSKRAEIKNQIASLTFRMNKVSGQGRSSRAKRSGEKGAR
jgi:hypothetical protein